MLDQPRKQSLEALVSGSSFEELIWINGFVAGAVSVRTKGSGAPRPASVSGTSAPVPRKLTLAYGTETGNAKSLAGKLSAIARTEGIVAKTVALDQYRPDTLSKEQHFVVIISTQGDGEPPAAAQQFYDHLHRTEALLPQLRYGVIALGDSSYPLFCQTGKDVDARLKQLGAQRILKLQLCDTDYEEPATQWFMTLTKSLELPVPESSGSQSGTVPAKATGHRTMYTGIIRRNVNLNDRGSEKQTHHIELAAEGVDYRPGDALGLIPRNPEALVVAILERAGIQATQLLRYREEELPAGELLRHRVNISYLPARVVKKYGGIVAQEVPDVPVGLYDLLRIYPVRDEVQFLEVLQILDPVTPRLYSIASSPLAHASEVHITVKRDEFCIGDEHKYGLCSDYLTSLPADSELSFYIHPNKRFRLPAPETDIIMVGAGTGIAPFRSFVAERAEAGGSGRNWLFFGDQRFASDFLYQTEWQAHKESGVLTHINTAFSRDQPEKVYVQHKLKARGGEIFEWLERGATIYVCGARQPMSIDVERALLEIIAQYGGYSDQDAETYLQGLAESDRYLKDVY